MSSITGIFGNNGNQRNQTTSLIHTTDFSQDENFPILQEILKGLSRAPDSIVEVALKAKLSSCPPFFPGSGVCFASYLLEHAPELLSIYQRVVPLQTNDISQTAQDDALYMPKPKIAATTTLPTTSSMVNNIKNTFHNTMLYMLGFVSNLYYHDFSTTPTTPAESEKTLNFLRKLSGVTFSSALGFFVYFQPSLSTQNLTAVSHLAAHVNQEAIAKLACIAIACFATFSALKWAYRDKALQVQQERLDMSIGVSDLTKKELPKSWGRHDELTQIISCICAPSDSEPTTPILLGPTGAGKTEIVNKLSQRIRNGEIPQLEGKKLLYINAEQLMKEPMKATGLIVQLLEGREEDTILFIDEFHTIAMSSYKAPFERLKTELTNRRMRCILATTEVEYKQYIEKNTAFVDRLEPIKINLLDKKSTEILLSHPNVDMKAVKKIVEIGLNQENPLSLRKMRNMRNKAVNYVYSWVPRKLNQLIEELEINIAGLQEELKENRSTEKLAKLNQLQKELQEKKTQNTNLTTLHKMFVSLNAEKKDCETRQYTLVHTIASDSSSAKPNDIAALAWIQQVMLPALEMRIDKIVSIIKEKFDERVPQRVTQELVEELFGS